MEFVGLSIFFAQLGGLDLLLVRWAVAFRVCSGRYVAQPTPRAPPARHTTLQYEDNGTGRVPGGVNRLTGSNT